MKKLAKHIEVLLLENNCVIVPGLGGFIAHYQPAHFDETRNEWVPPMRTFGFNPQLAITMVCWRNPTCKPATQTFRMLPV